MSFNWTAFAVKIGKAAVAELEGVLHPKVVAIANAALNEAGTVQQAVTSKGATSDVVAAAQGFVGVAQAAGVPQQTLSTIAAAGSTVAPFAQMGAALLASEMPEHQALGAEVQRAAEVFQAVSAGVQSELTPPGNG